MKTRGRLKNVTRRDGHTIVVGTSRRQRMAITTVRRRMALLPRTEYTRVGGESCHYASHGNNIGYVIIDAVVNIPILFGHDE